MKDYLKPASPTGREQPPHQKAFDKTMSDPIATVRPSLPTRPQLLVYDGASDEPDILHFDGSMVNTEQDRLHNQARGDDENLEDDDMDVGELEGYQDLQEGDYEDGDVPVIFEAGTSHKYESGPTALGFPRKVASSFFPRTVKLAERSASRTKFNKANSFLLLDELERVEKPTSRVPGTFGRRDRGKGEPPLPAYSKKVTADLDSDDELMMKMRFEGYTDQQVADRLRLEGRVRYDRKSISTRVMRIKAKQAERIDSMLEGGYLEWEITDDTRLMQAIELADIEVSYEVEKAHAKRWSKVSEHMRKLNPDGNAFSANACAARHTSLLNGTAVPPSMEDDDPNSRLLELEANRQAFLAKQEADRKAKEDQAQLQQQIAETARLRQAQKAEEIAARRLDAATKKAERAITRAANQQLKAQRAHQNELNKIARNARLQQEKAAKAAKQAAKATAAVATTTTKRTPAKTKGAAPKSTKTIASSSKATPKPSSPYVANAADPRMSLSIADLQGLCAKRGMRDVEHKSKVELLGALKAADGLIPYSDLFKKAREQGITLDSSNRTKASVLFQMALKEARSCASYEKDDDEMQE